jgi:adenylate kinase
VNDQGSDEAKEGNEDGEEEAVQPKEEEEEKPIEYTFFEDADFNEREPLPAYCYIKEIEDRVLSIQKENVKVFVICPGIVYGCGEDTFYPLFRAAWLQDPNPLPFIGGGENVISTIHLKDLVRFVVKVAENPPEGPPYLLAFDETKDKQLKSIVEGISAGVGSGTVRAVDKSDLF